MFDAKRISKGKITCCIDKVINFIPNSVDDIMLPSVVGRTGYVGESIKLTTNKQNTTTNLYECGFSTFNFDMSRVLCSEFTVEGIKGLDGYYNMTASIQDDAGNIVKFYTNDITGTETRVSTSLNNVTTDKVLIDKHNISGNADLYYNFTIQIDKQFGKVSLFHNDQIMGYLDVSGLDALGENSRFVLYISNSANGGKSVTIRQVKVSLKY